MAPRRNVYSVGEVNKYIGRMFEEDYLLHRISVSGEVSNYKDHTSGHIYLTLKDDGGCLSAVMFKSRRANLKFPLKNGDRIIATGCIEVYEKAGSYQLYIDTIERAGEGDIYARIEELKRELAEMGMFDAMFKKPIPRFASKVGVVTAPTGAAVRDIIQISRRRNPYVQIILSPAQVQGEGAEESICKAIALLDSQGCDVMIVGRGGGSIEDLMAFNSEAVARAIFEAQTPVISAVGHETDNTIADLVADLRAPTPSAGAELAVYDVSALLMSLDDMKASLRDRMDRNIRTARTQALYHEKRLSALSPVRRVSVIRQKRSDLRARLQLAMKRSLSDSRQRLALCSERLGASSPHKRLEAGFAYVSSEDNRRIRDIDDLEAGDGIRLRFKSGEAKARIEEIISNGRQ